ncbi:MAG: DUF2914 domain-containing protein [Gammaproteobacteria bacterium]|nr:DUF2914 domain-containing protein [Gammaproteobacteria bacterium]
MHKSAIAVLALLSILWLPLAAQAEAEAEVARAIISTGVVDREPVDDLEHLNISDERAYFFTELRGMAGQRVSHRWSHAGEVQAEVDFNVGGPRWRVWSNKGIMGHQRGEWLVEVVNAEGEVIHQKRFQYAHGAE